MLQDVRAASVRALTQATLLALHRDDFKRMLGNLQVIMPATTLWCGCAVSCMYLLVFTKGSQACLQLHVPALSPACCLPCTRCMLGKPRAGMFPSMISDCFAIVNKHPS